MKKLIIASTFPLAMLVAGAASADTLALSGKVDYQCDLTLQGQGASNINIIIGNQALGAFTVTCNDPDGFDVSVTSANSGELVNGTYSVPYKLKFDGNSATDLNVGFTKPSFNPPTVNGFSMAHADADGATYDMTFKVDDSFGDPLPGGVELTDTLTFAINGL